MTNYQEYPKMITTEYGDRVCVRDAEHEAQFAPSISEVPEQPLPTEEPPAETPAAAESVDPAKEDKPAKKSKA